MRCNRSYNHEIDLPSVPSVGIRNPNIRTLSDIMFPINKRKKNSDRAILLSGRSLQRLKHQWRLTTNYVDFCCDPWHSLVVGHCCEVDSLEVETNIWVVGIMKKKRWRMKTGWLSTSSNAILCIIRARILERVLETTRFERDPLVRKWLVEAVTISQNVTHSIQSRPVEV